MRVRIGFCKNKPSIYADSKQNPLSFGNDLATIRTATEWIMHRLSSLKEGQWYTKLFLADFSGFTLLKCCTGPEFGMASCLPSQQRISILKNRRCGLIKRKMERGCKETGVPVIRIHDLRHSHVSICGRYSDKNGWCFLD